MSQCPSGARALRAKARPGGEAATTERGLVAAFDREHGTIVRVGRRATDHLHRRVERRREHLTELLSGRDGLLFIGTDPDERYDDASSVKAMLTAQAAAGSPCGAGTSSPTRKARSDGSPTAARSSCPTAASAVSDHRRVPPRERQLAARARTCVRCRQQCRGHRLLARQLRTSADPPRFISGR